MEGVSRPMLILLCCTVCIYYMFVCVCVCVRLQMGLR